MKRDDLPRLQPELPTPAQLIAPGVQDCTLLTRSPARSVASAADLKPAPPRPGSEDLLRLPSRMGSRLVYRDGRQEAAC